MTSRAAVTSRADLPAADPDGHHPGEEPLRRLGLPGDGSGRDAVPETPPAGRERPPPGAGSVTPRTPNGDTH